MFSVATTCVVLVFLSSANTLDFTNIVKNKAPIKNIKKSSWIDHLFDDDPVPDFCVCKEVQNLEIYATDENSISIRYDLPNKTISVPIEIKVIRCEYDTKSRCKSSISNITRCSVYPAKYCADIQNLANNSKHLLKISLRNDITPIFGVEKEIEAEVLEKIPGKPKINMPIFDCPDIESCNLNIIFDHPYNQNGSITAFNIILNSIETLNNVTDVMTKHESFKIYNKNYLPQYHYQIKYVPYRKKYNLYIQSENLKYKSDFTMVEVVNTRNAARANINENPELLKTTEDSFTFKLPTFVHNMAFEVTIIVQDYDESQKVQIDQPTNRKLCLNYGYTWIANKTRLEPETVTISQDISGRNRLIPNTKYCVTILMKNSIVEHDLFFENLELLHSSDDFDFEPNTNVYRYFLFICLVILILSFVIIILGCIFVVRLLKMRKPKVMDHQYEDMDDNYNEYDHLSHK